MFVARNRVELVSVSNKIILL